MDASQLLIKIAKSFPAKPMPSISLRQALLADQGMSRCITTPEWEAERLKDGAIPWPMLSDAALVECRDGLAHLDEESFAYYLGGFLRFAVNHLDASLLSPEGELLGSVVFSVTQRSNYNLRRLKCLTDDQIDTVVDFLRLVQERSETHGTYAEKALKRYWETPEARKKR